MKIETVEIKLGTLSAEDQETMEEALVFFESIIQRAPEEAAKAEVPA